MDCPDDSVVVHGSDKDDSSEPRDNGDRCGMLSELMDRAKALQTELNAFRSHLRELRLERNIELGYFRGNVQSELNMLERLCQSPGNEATEHIARSSNLPFLERLWATAKANRGLVALQKRIHTTSSLKMLSQGMRRTTVVESDVSKTGNRRGFVIIDAMAEYGLAWIKVSLVTNNRILFDLAKQGWESGISDSEDDAVFNRPPNPGADDRDIPLLKTTKELIRASRCFRVRTRIPQVYVMLPRIEEGVYAEVDAILEACRAEGARLVCGDACKPSLPLDAALATMAPDPLSTFGDVANIDCTILLALVSEFSHAKVSKEPWFHPALKRQVEIEGNENLLPALLYPAMAARRLVATDEAIKRMREIVDTIGTASEKARTAILLGDDKTRSRESLLQDMQQWSAHDVPADWKLPIEVIDSTIEDLEASVPHEAKVVCADMTSINKSVFLYGWSTGHVTLTSNRTIVKQIESALEQFTDLGDEVWPKLWLCPTARSLVGKEKRGVTREEKKQDILPLPDPLRREEQRRNGLDVLSLREGRPVEDLRPDGYDYGDVIAAKNASLR